MYQQLNRLQNGCKKYSTIDSIQFQGNINKKQYISLSKRHQMQSEFKQINKKNRQLKQTFIKNNLSYESQLALPKLRRCYKSENESSDIQKIGKSFTTNVINQNIKDKQEQKQLIRINLTNSRYKVTQNVCNDLNFNICYDENQQSLYQTQKWDFKWTDSAITTQYISKLSKNQRINFFCGISSISRKNQLISNLDRMRRQFKQQYNFFPDTFLFPSQSLKLNKYYRDKIIKGQNAVFIVKPQASCQGRGIYLCNSLYDIQCESKCVVQNYLCNPMLFEGLKFDLRVYALITNTNPLSIFIYREGLVRLATEKYQQPDQTNFQNLCMHLTNYAINKNNPNFKFNKSVQDLKYGHKQSLAEFFKLIREKGVDSHQIWSQIKTNIVKTLISVQPHLNYQYRMAQPKNQDCSVCYHVLGFDFMIDDKGKCYLLEVNQTPSYSTEAPIDYLIKSYLIKDTLNIIKNQRKQAMKASKITHKIQLKKKIRTQYSQKQYDAWQILNEVQKSYLGNYQRIYPSKFYQIQREYQKLLAYAKISYTNIYQSQKSNKQLYIFNRRNQSKINKSKTIGNRTRQTIKLRTQASQKKLFKKHQNSNFTSSILSSGSQIQNFDKGNASNIANALKIPVNNIKSFIEKRKILSQFNESICQASKLDRSSLQILQRLKSGGYFKQKIQRLYKNPLQNVIQQRQFYQKQLQTNSNKDTNANQ